jgi:hypothetical protein
VSALSADSETLEAIARFGLELCQTLDLAQ